MKKAEEKFAEKFAELFIKKAEDASPKVDEEAIVKGTQDTGDPGEEGGADSDWEGTDPEQYSPQVKARAKDTREGALGRMFVAPPSPKGVERAVKVAHQTRPTVQERVYRLTGRR